MNAAQFHLLVNHIPIIGSYLAIPLLVLSYFFKKEKGILIGALLVVLITGLGSVVSSVSGENAEEIAEKIPAIQHDKIHVHEESAEVANVLAIVSGGISLLALVMLVLKKSDKIVKMLKHLVLLGIIITAALMVKTGHTGGLIRHPEIASASSAAVSTIGKQNEKMDNSSNHEDEDDDDD
ncbi:hypothetical protein K8I28_03125 [bacterium]|nr:hypothetical protein [bacterium]